MTDYKRYKIKIPSKNGKLVTKIFFFNNGDLEKLLNYYKVPYVKLDNNNRPFKKVLWDDKD